MGGSGSGRWGWHNKKSTVEECLVLSAGKLARDGIVAQSPGSGSIWWTNSTTGERTASAGYSREIDNDLVILRLRYTVIRRDSTSADIEDTVVIRLTPSAVGGRRWWFTCQLFVSGRACGRRVGKLYLPPRSQFFGCRHCYDLTYTSCQESHKYDRLMSQLASATGVEARLVKAMFARR